MGVYHYGVSSRSRKIKGFDKPVYNIKFLGKAPGFSFSNYQINSWENIVAGYDRKASMRGELVAQEIFPDDKDGEAEQFVIVYRYNRGDNVYNDGGDMNFLEVVGYAERIGNRYVQISKERHDAELKRLDDEKYVTVPLQWFSPL